MKTDLKLVLFKIGEHAFTWKDVFLSAKLSGEWAELEAQTTQQLACKKKFQEEGESLEEDEVSLEEESETAGEEFRYERNLVTAEEMESWLQARNLTLDEWMEYIEQTVLAKKWSDDLEEIAADFSPDAEELDTAVEIYGICSDRFLRFVNKLAGKAALYESKAEKKDPDVAIDLQKVPPDLRGEEGIERLCVIEEFFESFLQQALTDEAIREQIENHSLDWICFTLNSLSFPEESMAREAALCVREDGMTMEQVAADADVELQEEALYFSDMSETMQSYFLSAQQGELIGPVPHPENGFALLWVLDKTLPDPEEPEIRQKAEERLIQRLLTQERNRLVKWCVPI